MSAYLPALRRFWWLIVVGVIFAALAGAASVYKLPSFEARDQPVYTATARMLVTGANAPYFRTAVTRTDASETTPANRNAAAAAAPQTSAPDVTTLIRAANTFPLIIESDQVGAVREAMFGPAPEGAFASANAIYQVATPGRFRLSEIPVVQVFGTAGSPQAAILFTKQTTDAFMRYLKQQQNAAGIPPKQRIVIQAIRTPYEAVPSRTTSRSLAVLVFFAVSLAFCLLAIVLDKLNPGDGGTSGGVVATIGPAAADAEAVVEMPAAAAGGTVALHRSPGPPGSVPPGAGLTDERSPKPKPSSRTPRSPRRTQDTPKPG